MTLKKKLTSVLASAVLVGAMAAPSLAVVKDPNLDNVNVKVWKNILTGEKFSGMGKHAEKCFEDGIGLVKGTSKIRKAYTKPITVLFITGRIESLYLNGEKGTLEQGTDKTFVFQDKDARTTDDGRKYFDGKAVIKVMKNSEKDLDLEIIR
ncbi:hypothetical protein HMPREF1639_04360 [Peptostreptococcus sp. MV1]|uniref:hypothetical protein n=1 Tax=Peptostreptococcus sp. MV1 TaxID=1219626 RepID=UPI00051005DE|nr:hypothetical protein [Peptostreptococcus sp. MV1]KGF13062.1 hypothetical protein HMPREF1639_04360 [Peptostreptococcus sp. MV1]